MGVVGAPIAWGQFGEEVGWQGVGVRNSFCKSLQPKIEEVSGNEFRSVASVARGHAKQFSNFIPENLVAFPEFAKDARWIVLPVFEICNSAVSIKFQTTTAHIIELREISDLLLKGIRNLTRASGLKRKTQAKIILFLSQNWGSIIFKIISLIPDIHFKERGALIFEWSMLPIDFIRLRDRVFKKKFPSWSLWDQLSSSALSQHTRARTCFKLVRARWCVCDFKKQAWDRDHIFSSNKRRTAILRIGRYQLGLLLYKIDGNGCSLLVYVDPPVDIEVHMKLAKSSSFAPILLERHLHHEGVSFFYGMLDFGLPKLVCRSAFQIVERHAFQCFRSCSRLPPKAPIHYIRRCTGCVFGSRLKSHKDFFKQDIPFAMERVIWVYPLRSNEFQKGWVLILGTKNKQSLLFVVRSCLNFFL